MKTKLLFLALLTSLLSWGQGVEDFTNIPTASTNYLTRSWTGTDGVTWSAIRARTDQTLTGKAICTDGTGSVTSPSYAGGMGTLSFNYVRAFTGTNARSIEVWVNGVQIGSTITVSPSSNTVVNYNQTINVSGSVVLELRTSGAQIKIDDISWTAYTAGPAPILSITPATTNLGTSCVGTPTTAVTYTITNSGTVAATGVTVVSSGTHNTNFVVSGFTAGSTITAGNSATYTVTFTPSATGARSATITVASTTSGSNSPTTALTGTGTAVVAPVVNTSTGATAILDVSATLNGNVTTLGVCPASIQKGFVYSETAVNNLPTNGGIGVTTTPGVAVGTTGAYSEGIIGLTPNTNYTYRAYVFDGVTYTYSPVRTFTTIGVPVVSNGSFSGTAGTAIATFNLSTLSTNSPTSYAITSGALPTGLTLNTSTGAITGTPTATGTFIINFSATNVIGTSATSGIVTITINPTQNSDIVAVAGSSPATISSTINTATISTVTDGVQVWSFTIRDGGASSDADGLPTTLTALTITQGGANSISNWTHAIQSVALFDGSTFVANGTINANNIVFSGISVVAPDNGSKTLTMRLSLTCPLGATAVDGNDFDFSITQANITFLATGSGKNTGAPVASTPDNTVNFIQVVATSLSFTTQPSSTGVTVAMPNVVVTATDACGNRDVNFTGVVTLNSTGTITGAPLTVNAVAGVATFSGIIHTATGTGFTMNATATGLTSITSNAFDIVTVTVLLPGDFAIVAVNTSAESTGSADEITFVSFKDISVGTQIFLTDNGYERVTAGLWGNTEGIVSLTRTGSALPKGTFVTIHSQDGGIGDGTDFTISVCGVEDTNWTKNEISATGKFDLNKDDQVWFTQGGAWTNVNTGSHNTAYSGNVLYGWTDIAWKTAPGYASTAGSTIIEGFKCFTTDVNNVVTGASRVTFNFDSFSSVTTNDQLDWVVLINNPANWTAHTNNSGYFGSAAYALYNSTSCSTMTIATDLHTAGVWTGATDTNWFNCSNWDTLKVPDQNTNVLLSSAKATQEAVISSTATDATLYGNIAKTNNLTISAEKVEIVNSGTTNILEVHGDLLIDNSGALDMNVGGTTNAHIKLYGNWTNNVGNTAFDEGQGTVTFTGTTPQIISNVTPEGTETFNNLILNNNFNTSVSNNIIAKGNLTVNTGKTLTITADDYAEVTNSVFNSGTFNILNDGSLIQVNDLAAANTGSINYERKATVKLYDYVYWSSPTINFNMSGIVSHSRYYWDAQDPNANGTQGDWLAASGNMENGRGYIFRVPNSYATTSSPDNLTANFTGVPFNGIKNMEVKRGDLASATDSDWNLIGNPYPSAIDVVSTAGFLDYNTNLEGFVYVWTHGNSPFDAAYPNPFYQNYTYNYNPNDYTQINRTGNSVAPGDIKIAAGQGFFVQMTPGPATTAPHETVTFKNSFRSKNHTNNQFYRMANNAVSDDERNRLWLDLNSTQTSTRILVGYVDGATNAFDRMYDASTEVKTAEQNFYSTLNNEIFKIQGKALPFNENDVVPLGVNITATGMHNIALANADGLFTGNQNIYLEDTQLGIIHDLRVNPYNFTAPLGVNNSRFILRYTNGTLSQDEIAEVSNSVFVVSNESLTISSLKESIKAIEIYDLLGRKLYQDQNVNSLSQTISSIQKTNSGLIIYITLENEKQVVKKTIY